MYFRHPIADVEIPERTLNRVLGTRGCESTHCADHEVLEHLVAGLALVALVMAEIGDLGGLAAAKAAEGRVERAGVRRAGSAFAGRGGEGANGERGQRGAWQSAQQRARGGGERGHGERRCGVGN